jgi:hypothetical protein
MKEERGGEDKRDFGFVKRVSLVGIKPLVHE